MLGIELRPSNTLAGILLLLHLGAVLIVFFVVYPGWLRLGLFSVCVWSLWSNLRQHAWRNADKAIISFVEQYDEWYLIDRAKNKYSATLCGDSIVTPYFAILNFRRERRTIKSIVILPDTIQRDSFRRLRVHLRSLPG